VAVRSSVTDELRWAADAGSLRAVLGYEVARDALQDPRGWTVRCTPRRRTRLLRLEEHVFCKVRRGGLSVARDEWRALERLASLGIRAPRPVFLACAGRTSVLGIRAVAGRPADSWIRDELRADRDDAVTAWAGDHVAGVVRRLHDAGLFYRDLYWNHLFVTGSGDPPALIDAERLLEPRVRRRRWRVKDLAGLEASWPADARAPLDALLSALDVDGDLLDAVHAKAARIRERRPKFGD